MWGASQLPHLDSFCADMLLSTKPICILICSHYQLLSNLNSALLYSCFRILFLAVHEDDCSPLAGFQICCAILSQLESHPLCFFAYLTCIRLDNHLTRYLGLHTRHLQQNLYSNTCSFALDLDPQLRRIVPTPNTSKRPLKNVSQWAMHLLGYLIVLFYGYLLLKLWL